VALSQVARDYYALLQVHPDADTEVIEAAYRQLMKKHHPDVAGDDPARVAAHHERSKAINQAFGVLRDPEQRRGYDAWRRGGVTRAASDAARPKSAPATAERPVQNSQPPAPPPPQATPVEIPSDDRSRQRSEWLVPFSLIVDAYYLLPGQYEWESGRRSELLTVVLLPILGVAGFCLATGRLSPWLGSTPSATLLAWGLLALAALPLWQALPRIALAAVPTLALLTGSLNPFLTQAHVPLWLAWPSFGFLSLLLSARVYVFSVLPTLAICWLVVSLT
jgi:hypothetical protein